MATVNMVRQYILFISPSNSFDIKAILSNNLIQSLFQNSLGGKIGISIKDYSDVNGNVNPMLEMMCFVQPSFQATIQANLPNFQAAFPQYTIITEGTSTSVTT